MSWQTPDICRSPQSLGQDALAEDILFQIFVVSFSFSLVNISRVGQQRAKSERLLSQRILNSCKLRCGLQIWSDINKPIHWPVKFSCSLISFVKPDIYLTKNVLVYEDYTKMDLTNIFLADHCISKNAKNFQISMQRCFSSSRSTHF